MVVGNEMPMKTGRKIALSFCCEPLSPAGFFGSVPSKMKINGNQSTRDQLAFDRKIKVSCAFHLSVFSPINLWLRNRSFLMAIALGAVLLPGCSPDSSNEFQGYIEGEYVYVASPLGGTLQNLVVARGDEAITGQRLFQLERRSEADAVRQASNNLAQAKANLALSEVQYARREQLRNDQGVISAEELDQARAQRDADQAQVESQTAALAKADWSFEQKEQFAPTNAFVQDTLYRVGEWVAAGKPVVQLLPLANLKVRFFVPETALPKIHPGQTVSVLFDGGKHDYAATVNYISTEAEFTPPVIYSQENRAKLVYMIEAKFSPADATDLRPGQPVDVRLNP
jgi:HlyD family secretion protein